MEFKKILFPTDFSHCGDEALELATCLARDGGGELLIVHVEQPTLAYGGHERSYYGPPEPRREDLKKLLSKIIPIDPNVKYEHRYLIGDPAKTIIECAKNEKVDAIAISTHGRTGLSHVLMGSVTESIVCHAPCPVIVLKHHQH